MGCRKTLFSQLKCVVKLEGCCPLPTFEQTLKAQACGQRLEPVARLGHRRRDLSLGSWDAVGGQHRRAINTAETRPIDRNRGSYSFVLEFAFNRFFKMLSADSMDLEHFDSFH